MVRFTFYLIVSLAAVVAAAVWFSDRPGAVSIEWQGYLIELSVGRFVLAAAILVVALTFVVGVFRMITHAPGRFREGRQTSRRERGYRALTHGMVAVAAGDANEANRQARKADVLLSEPPLTMLLSAQAAQLNGDEAAAARYFTSMLDRPETAFLGVRGLLMQAQRDGDSRAALAYARQAYELQPKTPWVLNTMFDLQVREGQWRAALATLEEAVKRKAVAADEARTRRAAVLLGCSGEAELEVDLGEALRFARRANSLAPDYLPAVLRTVDLMVRTNKARAASRMIHTAWGRTPHPDLARLYGEIGDASDGRDPLKRVRRYEKLLSFNPDHVESHVALARAALDAELWGEARNHLEKAVAGDASAQACRMMADLEEREFGNTDSTRTWLLRASAASPDPVWLCDDCGTAADRWTPVCGHCGALGTQTWEPPPRANPLGLGLVAGPADIAEDAAASEAAGADQDALVLTDPLPDDPGAQSSAATGSATRADGAPPNIDAPGGSSPRT